MTILNRRIFLNLTAATAAATSFSPLLYAVGDRPYSAAHPLLLNQNENAYGMSPLAAEAARKSVSLGHRYADDYIALLEKKLAAKEGFSTKNVTIGTGSTGIIEAVVRTFADKNATFIEPALTYFQVKLFCDDWGLKIKRVPMLADFAIDIAAMEAQANKVDGPVVIYLVNPNNPTASLTSSFGIAAWIKRAPDNVFFIVDEAYHEYVEDANYQSATNLVEAGYKNLVVLRTFSKIFALAGMRIGYGLGHDEVIARVRRYYSAWNLGMAGLNAALAAIDDQAYVTKCLAANKQAKLSAYKTFDKIGLKYIPSHTNFILHESGINTKIYQKAMLDQHIKVGNDKGAGQDWSRLSLGTVEETNYFLERLTKLHS